MKEADSSKRAIVTGASSGIGREIVRQLAAAGWSVLAVARRAERLTELADESAGRVFPFPVDLSAEDAPQAVVAAAERQLGGLDLLVNNAGSSWVGPFAEMPNEQLDRVFGLNVRALMLLCRAAIPALERCEGQIINCSSMAAHLPMETLAAYCASKAAVAMFSRVLAKELAPRRIRVNALSPTGTDTELFETVGVDIDRGALVPAADMARLVLLLTELPAGLDIGEIQTHKRFVP